MKILQVTTHVNIGGIANYILNLSQVLKRKGVQVVVASSGGNLEEHLRVLGIPHEHLNIKTKFEFGPKVFISAFRIAAIVKKEKIDVIHSHTRVSQVAAVIASWMTGVPVVTTCHGYFKLRSRRLIDTWGKKVIAISDAVANHLKYDLGVSGDRVKIIYNGVDVDKFSHNYSPEEIAAVKKSLSIGDGPVIGTIGRLSQVKGQRYLVQAMADIHERRKDVKCVVVGDGEERRPLENLARALGIKDYVFFVSSNVDTGKFLAIMDVFVFPSVKEGLGIALLEAMASGKPSVASATGGISDIIRDPSVGILTPVGDTRSMTESIEKLLSDKEMRIKMGSAARKQVRDKFSLDAMGDKVIELYKEMVNV